MNSRVEEMVPGLDQCHLVFPNRVTISKLLPTLSSSSTVPVDTTRDMAAQRTWNVIQDTCPPSQVSSRVLNMEVGQALCIRAIR